MFESMFDTTSGGSAVPATESSNPYFDLCVATFGADIANGASSSPDLDAGDAFAASLWG